MSDYLSGARFTGWQGAHGPNCVPDDDVMYCKPPCVGLDTEARMTAVEHRIIDVKSQRSEIFDELMLELERKDQRIASLTAALNEFGQHRRENDAINGCYRLYKGMAFTNDSECNCGLYAALKGMGA